MANDTRTEPDSVEQRDLEWLEKVYRGDKERDLTVRAVLAGMVFGGLMSLSNLYVGLKTGWGLGVDIAAVIVIFAVFKALRGIGLVRREFGLMENTMMMTVAVAASWISSAGLVSAVPALTMLTGYEFVWWQLTLFIAVILYLGLFMAIPLKRQMIQVEPLRFPANIPTGETLKVIYAQGSQAIQKAAALGIAAVLGVIVAGLRDGLGLLPQEYSPPLTIKGVSLGKLTLGIQPSLIFVSIGALFGMKVGLSMLLGVIVNYGFLAPRLIDEKIVKHEPPQIKAAAAPQFPLEVKAGQSFTVKLEEAVSRPELPTAEELKADPKLASSVRTRHLTYAWKQPTKYTDLAALEKDLNAATLQDGSPNPLHGAIAVGEVLKKEMAGEESLTITVVLKKVTTIWGKKKEQGAEVLTLKAPADKYWEARLSLQPNKTEALQTQIAAGLKQLGLGTALSPSQTKALRTRIAAGLKQLGLTRVLTPNQTEAIQTRIIAGLKQLVSRVALPPSQEETVSALGFKISPDVEKSQAEFAKAQAVFTKAEGRLNAADAAKRAANAEISKAEAVIANSKDESAKAQAEKALVEAEIVRTKAEIARTKFEKAKRAKTEAENAMNDAEKGQDKATAAVGGFRNISAWSLWPGATVLVVGGLLALAFQWRNMGRTFASIFAGLGGRRNTARGPLDHIEIPMTWFIIGFPLAGLLATVLLTTVFGIHWWLGAAAVVLTFFLAAVVARAGAETGINPIGAMGKVTQLTFGALAPGNVTANLMTAGVTAGAACSCGDTVGNLKVGHMVGANPRRQFISQFFGVFAGAILAVPAYFILVPDANALGGEKFPAPSALVWKGVADVLSRGLSTIPHSALWAMGVAFVLGTIIVVIDNVFPKAKPYTPSPAALGIALTAPGSQGFAMFLGALIAWILEKKAAKWHEMYTIPVASGCIAGESIMGVIIATLIALGIMQ